ncbi:Sec-independent protein translocase protein TatB [Acinetobacter sp. AG3]|jgi:sec-independent protein translocase protein TatB|uniref:Sec-independent protein translocase protein TatB n=1 Tax=unclassified Acinetobacter TaxID=196816 RepID=UPI001EF10568|nr:Sec-independent protein translocase protein TatB [Acinetobacter sp. AG3]MCG7221388.1 Sec-independent protein translocase protein TatB [Acinetobacter sp. AG3]
MLDVGFSELLVFGIIALLVLGPDKLPEAARFVAKWYSKLKRLISNVQNDIDRELRLSELREQMQNEMQRIQELEQKMQAQMHELQQLSAMPGDATQQEQALALLKKQQLDKQQLEQPQLKEQQIAQLRVKQIYQPVSRDIPTVYLPSIWLKQAKSNDDKLSIVPVHSKSISQLKVAV